MKDLNLARSEAVKRGQHVTVCKISNTESCDTSANAEGWSDGWLVFVDNAATPGVWEAGEEVLRVYRDTDTTYSWKADNNLEKFVTYTPRGSSNINGWFTYCDGRSIQQARAILINSVGRPALSADSDNNKIYEDGTGNDLDCS